MSGRSQTMSDFTWQIIDDDAGLDGIEPEWSALNAKCGPDGFFKRHEVLRANWTRHREDPRTSLHLVLFRDRGKLVMGAPMVRVREALGTCKLLWLDSKTPLYDDVLVDPDLDIGVAAREFRRYLLSTPLNRVLKIGFILEDSALHRLLEAAGLKTKSRTAAQYLGIADYESWEQYLSQLSPNRRQKYRAHWRKAINAGAKPCRLVTDPIERRQELARLFAQKRIWLEEQDDLADWIVPEETEAWFQFIADHDDVRNRSHLLWMGTDTQWIASILYFERDGTIFLSKFVHDKQWEQYSPGWLIIHEVVMLGIQQGLKQVDFMIGAGSWKDRLSDSSRKIYSCRAGLLPWQRNSKL